MLTGHDPSGSLPHQSLIGEVLLYVRESWIECKKRIIIPPYQAKNIHWEITFKALGWSRDSIEKFWVIFCRINRSRSGEITIIEFLNYFNLDRTQYVEKCFNYFDTTGGNDIDFLEFMVSVWNICTLDGQTLTNFTFDLYDLDSDGELTYPEIEKMVQELFGSSLNLRNKRSKECLNDLTILAEDKGGVITLDSFASFTMNHSLLLFPVFQIQRAVQTKVMGLRYWQAEIERRMKLNGKDKQSLSPRRVQNLLRTYKTGSVAAILTHTGDPNVALKNWYLNNNGNEALKAVDNENQSETKKFRKSSFWNRISAKFSSKRTQSGRLRNSVDVLRHFRVKNDLAPDSSNICIENDSANQQTLKSNPALSFPNEERSKVVNQNEESILHTMKNGVPRASILERSDFNNHNCREVSLQIQNPTMKSGQFNCLQ